MQLPSRKVSFRNLWKHVSVQESTAPPKRAQVHAHAITEFTRKLPYLHFASWSRSGPIIALAVIIFIYFSPPHRRPNPLVNISTWSRLEWCITHVLWYNNQHTHIHTKNTGSCVNWTTVPLFHVLCVRSFRNVLKLDEQCSKQINRGVLRVVFVYWYQNNVNFPPRKHSIGHDDHPKSNTPIWPPKRTHTTWLLCFCVRFGANPVMWSILRNFKLWEATWKNCAFV